MLTVDTALISSLSSPSFSLSLLLNSLRLESISKVSDRCCSFSSDKDICNSRI